MALLHDAAAYCRKLTEKSKSNFYYAFLFLPTERRRALEAVYAYCRLVDDVVDQEATDEAKQAGLAYWQQQLELLFSEQPIDTAALHAVTAELRTVVARFGVRREDLEAIIDGCAMDVGALRYETWDDLRLYCYRVASAVGLMCVRIFGDATPDVDRYAVDLGIALQLTNILRDVAEDARRGRIYLPAEDLVSFGVDENELTSGIRSPQFVRMMRFEAARARATTTSAPARKSAPAPVGNWSSPRSWATSTSRSWSGSKRTTSTSSARAPPCRATVKWPSPSASSSRPSSTPLSPAPRFRYTPAIVKCTWPGAPSDPLAPSAPLDPELPFDPALQPGSSST